MNHDVCAVGVGYNFALVPTKDLNGIPLHDSGAVHFENKNWTLFKADTYEDSRKIDALLDRYGEHPISEHRIEPVIMRGELEMTVPGFDRDRDSFCFGGYIFVCDGKKIPVDFSGIAWSIEQNGDRLSIPFVTGRTGFATDCFLADCYSDDYAQAGLRINDITAEFLSRASSVSEFTVSLEMDGKEYMPEDIAEIGQFSIKSLCFENGSKEYPVKQDVLDAFNRSIGDGRKKPLAEQIRSAASRAGGGEAAAEAKEKDAVPEP